MNEWILSTRKKYFAFIFESPKINLLAISFWNNMIYYIMVVVANEKKIATEWQWEKIIIHTTTTKNNKKIKKKKFSNIGKSICLFFFTFLHWLRHSNLRKVKPLKTKQKMKKKSIGQSTKQTNGNNTFVNYTCTHTQDRNRIIMKRKQKKDLDFDTWIKMLLFSLQISIIFFPELTSLEETTKKKF